jgi:hypothetical protein
MFCADDDMAFPHDLCARLIAAEKPVVGTIATTREIEIDKVEKALAGGLPLKQALLVGHKWIVRNLGEANGPLRKADGIGAAVCLIRRDALELMISKNAVRKLTLFGTQFYGFFLMRREDAAAEMVAEDTSFFRRWQIDCGGEVWALTDVPIMHIDDFAYGGRYSDLPPSHEPPFATR